jgi:hypothetical protein
MAVFMCVTNSKYLQNESLRAGNGAGGDAKPTLEFNNARGLWQDYGSGVVIRG